MKLLLESVDIQNSSFNDFGVIVEQANPTSPSTIKISGPYICCDMKNVNGRTYSLKYFKDEVIPEYMKTWVTPRRAYAELNHAQSAVVDPKNACEIITDLKEDGNYFIGESTILSSDKRFGVPGTPNGDILAAILLRGGKIGKSTRGAVDNPKNKIIDENNRYLLVTIDTVLDPSGPNCYVNDVVTEGVLETKEYMIDSYGLLVECAFTNYEEKLKHLPNTFETTEKNNYIFDAFNQFLNDIKQK